MHTIATEQNEILLLNHLKALFNSIRSTIELTIAQSEFMEAEETIFLLERIKIFEKEICMLKINQSLLTILAKGLAEFKKQIQTTSVSAIIKTFQEKIVIPLETKMLELHPTKEEKNWVRSSFMVLR